MKWKNRLTNYNFWISIVSAVLLILQAFDFEYDIAYVNEIATAVLGLLVVIGIINDPTKSSSSSSDDNKGSTEVTSENTTETEIEKTEIEEALNTEKNQTECINAESENNNDKVIPIEQENEANFNTDKNDFEVLVESIKADLLNKIDELKSSYSQINLGTQSIDSCEEMTENNIDCLTEQTDKTIDTESNNSLVTSNKIDELHENNSAETNITKNEETKIVAPAIEIQTINNIVN